jgi:hypothetical protein
MLSEQLCESMRREQAAGNAKTGPRGQDESIAGNARSVSP